MVSGPVAGAITVAVGPTGRRYSARDQDFGGLVGGPIASVLENAGLTRQVRRTERRMTAALDTLDEAVTMNGPDGRTVYVNDAAVRLLKAESAEELPAAMERTVALVSRRHRAASEYAGESLEESIRSASRLSPATRRISLCIVSTRGRAAGRRYESIRSTGSHWK